MASNSESLYISPESELGLRIRATADTGEQVIVDIGDESYRLIASSVYRRPDPETVERSVAGIRAASGSWKDIDVSRLKAYIRARRRSSSRPRVEL